MRSLNPVRLTSQADVDLFDDIDALDEALDAAILAGEFDLPLNQEDDEPSQVLSPLPQSSAQFLWRWSK